MQDKSRDNTNNNVGHYHFGLSKDLKSTVFQHKVESLGIDRFHARHFSGNIETEKREWAKCLAN